jgi:BASS family bile acid:Na+ symporter
VAGLVANRILYGEKKWNRAAGSLAGLAAGSAAVGVGAVFVKASALGIFAALKSGIVIGFLLIALAAGARLAVVVWLKAARSDWMDKALPAVSMFGICLIIGIITARSRDQLLSVGLALFGAAILHNGLGYFLGYWGARAAKLDESSCRAVAFEVGMQNGGMASGIAMDVLRSSSAALAPAIFGPWMNISGSILANWWRRHKIGVGPN